VGEVAEGDVDAVGADEVEFTGEADDHSGLDLLTTETGNLTTETRRHGGRRREWATDEHGWGHGYCWRGWGSCQVFVRGWVRVFYFVLWVVGGGDFTMGVWCVRMEWRG
jgi:hypothetical protein